MVIGEPCLVIGFKHIKPMFRMAKGTIKGHMGMKVPMNIMWRITNRCNSKCSYCNIWKRKQKELTTKQILSLIDEMDELGTARIGFVGGEAFLRDDFEQIVDYVKSKGIFVTLVSNGCLVPNNVALLKKLDHLVLSFDGRKENHERGRMKGSFSHVMKAFGTCKQEGITVLTNTVLNKHNLDDLDYILKVVSDFGFSATFNVLQGNCEYPSNEVYRTALNHLLTRKKQGHPIVLSEKALKFLIKWPDYSKFVKNKYPGFKCWAGQLIYNIDTDGTIAACDIMSHMRKDNPDATKGLKRAIAQVKKECQACTCAHVIEYNYMLSLKIGVIKGWIMTIFG